MYKTDKMLKLSKTEQQLLPHLAHAQTIKARY